MKTNKTRVKFIAKELRPILRRSPAGRLEFLRDVSRAMIGSSLSLRGNGHSALIRALPREVAGRAKRALRRMRELQTEAVLIDNELAWCALGAKERAALRQQPAPRSTATHVRRPR